jgi:hypothetical protein
MDSQLRTLASKSALLVPRRRRGIRLQVAAESVQALVFAFRDARAAANASPAALRLQVERDQLRVLKCRGGLVPPAPVPFLSPLH